MELVDMRVLETRASDGVQVQVLSPVPIYAAMVSSGSTCACQA